MEQNAREKRSRWLRDLLCGALIGGRGDFAPAFPAVCWRWYLMCTAR